VGKTWENSVFPLRPLLDHLDVAVVADVGVKAWESFHVILLQRAIAMCLGWCRQVWV